MLAMHPDVQQRVYDEIKSLECNDYYDIDDLNKLKYTEMVLNETMRLFPPGPTTFRLITQPTKLKNCTLPVGTICQVPIYRLHHMKSIWGDNCDQFDPERFSTEQRERLDMFYFLPFMAGARNCLGQKFGMMSMKTSLCHLISKFSFQTDMKFEELQFSFTLTMNLANKYLVTAVRR